MATVDLLEHKVNVLERNTDALSKSVDTLKQADAELRRELTSEITTQRDTLKDAIAELRRDSAVVRQQMGELTKRIDEWDRRWWALIVLLVGALLSLASGLIVTLARK